MKISLYENDERILYAYDRKNVYEIPEPQEVKTFNDLMNVLRDIITNGLIFKSGYILMPDLTPTELRKMDKLMEIYISNDILKHWM